MDKCALDIRRGIISIGVVVIIAALASVGHAQQPNLQSTPRPVVFSVEDAPRVEPQSLDELSAREIDRAPSQRAQRRVNWARYAFNRARRARLIANLTAASAQSEQLLQSLEALPDQFEDVESANFARESQRLLDAYQQRIDVIRTEFLGIQHALEQTNRARLAGNAAGMRRALDALQQQLGQVGLLLVKRGERARLPNALKLDLDQLRHTRQKLESLLNRIIIVRPPAVSSPTQDTHLPRNITPPQIIRPPQGIAPSRQIIRPPRGIAPPNAIIRPPRGIAPSRQIIRPPSSIPSTPSD